MMNAPNTSFDTVIEAYPQYGGALQTIAQAIENVSPEELSAFWLTLERYLAEGENQSYQANTSALADFLAEKGLVSNSTPIVDLGSGPGDLVAQLAQRLPNSRVTGLDLSPSFVARFNLQREDVGNACLKVGVIDCPLPTDLSTTGTAISVLTLDRLRDPAQLIQNMAQFTGHKVLAALLPNNPVDDNPSRQSAPIIYTPEGRRITTTSTIEGNIAELKPRLEAAWENPVNVNTVPYTVNSSGDQQTYDLTVFSTTPYYGFDGLFR